MRRSLGDLAGKRSGLYNDRGMIKVSGLTYPFKTLKQQILRLNNNTAPPTQIFTIYEDKDRLCCPDKASAVQGVARDCTMVSSWQFSNAIVIFPKYICIIFVVSLFFRGWLN